MLEEHKCGELKLSKSGEVKEKKCNDFPVIDENNNIEKV